MDSILPMQLKSHLTMADIGRIQDKGIKVNQVGFSFIAQCRDAVDEMTVKAISDNTSLVNRYYYAEGLSHETS